MAAESSALQGVLVQEISGAHVVQHFENDKDVEVASGTLRVLMISVPLQDPFADTSKEGAASGKAKADDENDLWLALEVGPEFSLAVKSSQTVIPDRPTGSYVFPSADVPGAALRLRFDGNDKEALSELEDLLYDYCAFQNDEKKGQGSLELLDEKGALIGTIDGPWQLKEDEKMHVPGHEKDPVILELPDEQALSTGSNKQVNVTAAPRNEEGKLPAGYQNDWLLRGAHFVSRSMEKGSAWAGSGMLKIADSYVARSTPPRSASPSDPNFAAKEQESSQVGTTAPLAGTTPSSTTASGHKAITFSPTTHNTARSIHKASGKVSSVSNRTTAAILGAASNLGSSIGKRTGIQQKVGSDGTLQQPTGVRGALNRSLVAFNVVLDGVTTSAERLLKDGGEASGRMIEHRYGSEAKVISGNVASVGRSAFVVYKDINGVRRKALLKIAVGTIKARGPDGSEVILQQETLPDAGSANLSEKSAVNAASTSVDPPPYNPDAKAGKSSTSVAEKRPSNSALPATPRTKRFCDSDLRLFPSPNDSPARRDSVQTVLPRSYNLTPHLNLWPSTPEQVQQSAWLDASLGSEASHRYVVGENGYDSHSIDDGLGEEGDRSLSISQPTCATQSYSTLCTTSDDDDEFAVAAALSPKGLSDMLASWTHGLSSPVQSPLDSIQKPQPHPPRPLTSEHVVEQSGADKDRSCNLNTSHVADLGHEHSPSMRQSSCQFFPKSFSDSIEEKEMGAWINEEATVCDKRSITFHSANFDSHVQDIVTEPPRNHHRCPSTVQTSTDVSRADPWTTTNTSGVSRTATPTAALARPLKESSPLFGHATLSSPLVSRGNCSLSAPYASASDQQAAAAAVGKPLMPCDCDDTYSLLSYDQMTAPQSGSAAFCEKRNGEAEHQDKDDWYSKSSFSEELKTFSGSRPGAKGGSSQSTVDTGVNQAQSTELNDGSALGFSSSSMGLLVSTPSSSSRSLAQARMHTLPSTVTPHRVTTLNAAPYMHQSTFSIAQIYANTTPLHNRSASVLHSLGRRNKSNAATTSAHRSSSEDRGHESEHPFSSPPSSPCGNAKRNLGLAAGSHTNGQFSGKISASESPPHTPHTDLQFHLSSSSQCRSTRFRRKHARSSSSVDDSYMRPSCAADSASTDLSTDRSTPAPVLKKRRIVVRLGKRDDAGDTIEVQNDHSHSSPSAHSECQDHDASLYCNTASLKEEEEENDVACILLSLGHSAKTVNAFKADFSERTQRAIRRTQTETITHTRRSLVRKSNPEKAVTVKTERESIESTLNVEPVCSGNPNVKWDEIRVFPPSMPLLIQQFPLWYRRFSVPSQMSVEVRAQVFRDLIGKNDVGCDHDKTLRAALARSERHYGIWKDPENLFDLYTPRWMRSVGRDKEAMCSICYEEGRVLFLKTKTSQYNYHLINQHGISPVTRLPLDPPVKFRQVEVAKPGALDRHTMLQGECHVCSRFVNLQSVRDGEVNIPEIYWWKHASQCHKRLAPKSIDDEKGIFVEDELYHRVKKYSENLSRSSTDTFDLNESDQVGT